MWQLTAGVWRDCRSKSIWQARLYVGIQQGTKIVASSLIHLPVPFLIAKSLWQKWRCIACVWSVLPSCLICSFIGSILMGGKRLQFSCLLTFLQCELLHFSACFCLLPDSTCSWLVCAVIVTTLDSLSLVCCLRVLWAYDCFPCTSWVSQWHKNGPKCSDLSTKVCLSLCHCHFWSTVTHSELSPFTTAWAKCWAVMLRRREDTRSLSATKWQWKARGEGRRPDREQLYRLMLITYSTKWVKTDDCEVFLRVPSLLGPWGFILPLENSKSLCLWLQNCVYMCTHCTALQYSSGSLSYSCIRNKWI